MQRRHGVGHAAQQGRRRVDGRGEVGKRGDGVFRPHRGAEKVKREANQSVDHQHFDHVYGISDARVGMRRIDHRKPVSEAVIDHQHDPEERPGAVYQPAREEGRLKAQRSVEVIKVIVELTRQNQFGQGEIEAQAKAQISQQREDAKSAPAHVAPFAGPFERADGDCQEAGESQESTHADQAGAGVAALADGQVVGHAYCQGRGKGEQQLLTARAGTHVDGESSPHAEPGKRIAREGIECAQMHGDGGQG